MDFLQSKSRFSLLWRGIQGVQQEPWMLAYIGEDLIGRMDETDHCDYEMSKAECQGQEHPGWLIGTKINTLSTGKQGLVRNTTLSRPADTHPLHRIIQDTLDSSEGETQFLKWFTVMYWLATLGKTWGFSTSPFVSLARGMVCMEWAEAYFLHPEKCL